MIDKLKSPLKRLKGKFILTTLPYGSTMFREAYIKAGWSIRIHNGEDYICSLISRETYGIPIVASHQGTVSKVIFDGAMNTKGNGIYLDSEPYQGTDGNLRILRTVYWHLSEIKLKVGDKVETGQEIGLLGNSGMIANPIFNPSVLPQDLSDPFRLSHLHFGVYIYIFKNNQWQQEFINEAEGAVNPSDYLEKDWQFNASFIEKVEIENQLAPLFWVLIQLQEKFNRIKELLKKYV